MAIRGVVLLTCMLFAVSAHADPPSNGFLGARVTLSTSTIEHTELVHGHFQKRSIQLPSNVLDGYVLGWALNPPNFISSATTPIELVERTGRKLDMWFIRESGVLQIQYPFKAVVLVDADSQLFFPVSIIQKVEARRNDFDGYVAYGEPFPMPRSEALLLQTPPVYSCMVKYEEMGPVYWISYNHEVSSAQLDPICNRTTPPSAGEKAALKAKTSVFVVTHPDD